MSWIRGWDRLVGTHMIADLANHGGHRVLLRGEYVPRRKGFQKRKA
jgi:ribosomal protein S6E (S10)